MILDTVTKFDEYDIKIDNKNMSYMIYHKGRSPKTYEEILSTLKKIERILKEHLINKSEEDFNILLLKIAKDTHNAKLNILPPFFYTEKRVRNEYKEIKTLYERIENLGNPPSALPYLNLGLISIVVSFLFPKDLNSMASVNREAKQICHNRIRDLAKKAGCRATEEIVEVNLYLKEILHEINTIKNIKLSYELLFKDELSIDDVFTIFNEKKLYNPKFGKLKNFVFCQKINDTPSEWQLFNQMTEQAGQTALLHATLHNDLSSMNFLIKIGALFDLKDFTTRQKTALLHNAACLGEEIVLKRLIEEGADSNLKNRDGTSAIHFAAREGHTACVKVLLNKNTINLREEKDLTPLIRASQFNRVDVVELLLECGADIHLTDHRGNTALHFAVFNGHELVAKILLKNGINMNVVNDYEHTALHYAVRKKNTSLINLLKSHKTQRIT